jgi:glycerol-3-phosphate acyltransferase PlsX
MGGDLAPAAAVAGTIEAARSLGVRVALVGQADRIRAELARDPAAASLPVTIVDAPDVVAMDEAPLAALRRKPGASVKVAAELVARGEAQAFFSAGHTGAAFLAAHAAFGVLPGVDRPALAVTFPTLQGAAVLVDAGANLDCRPGHLAQFGIMGAAFSEVMRLSERPRVGLLSIGEEASKGTDLIRDAHALLVEAPVLFIGNLEARELFTGRADVIVCDGFTGNIALKVGEGLVEAIEQMLREEFDAAPLTQLGALLTRDAFKRFKQRVDYAEYGAAPLLGLGGLALVGHGRSSPRAVKSGIAMAARLAEGGLVPRLEEALHGKGRAEEGQRKGRGQRAKGKGRLELGGQRAREG